MDSVHMPAGSFTTAGIGSNPWAEYARSPKTSVSKGEPSGGGRNVVLSYIEGAIPGQSIHTGSGGSTLGEVCLHHTFGKEPSLISITVI